MKHKPLRILLLFFQEFTKRIDKIKNLLQISLAISIFIFPVFNVVTAQSKILNKYGLFLVNNTKILQKEIEKDSFKQMMWHFYLPSSSYYDLLHISFSDLKKIAKKERGF